MVLAATEEAFEVEDSSFVGFAMSPAADGGDRKLILGKKLFGLNWVTKIVIFFRL